MCLLSGSGNPRRCRNICRDDVTLRYGGVTPSGEQLHHVAIVAGPRRHALGEIGHPFEQLNVRDGHQPWGVHMRLQVLEELAAPFDDVEAS